MNLTPGYIDSTVPGSPDRWSVGGRRVPRGSGLCVPSSDGSRGTSRTYEGSNQVRSCLKPVVCGLPHTRSRDFPRSERVGEDVDPRLRNGHLLPVGRDGVGPGDVESISTARGHSFNDLQNENKVGSRKKEKGLITKILSM